MPSVTNLTRTYVCLWMERRKDVRTADQQTQTNLRQSGCGLKPTQFLAATTTTTASETTHMLTWYWKVIIFGAAVECATATDTVTTATAAMAKNYGKCCLTIIQLLAIGTSNTAIT